MKGLLKDRRGISVLELVIASTILCLVLVTTLAIFTTMARSWTKGSSGTNANMYASIAMRKLVLDMEEGKSAVASTDGSRLTVTFPYRASSTSDYTRDRDGQVVTYYLSGETGLESSGTYLWKMIGTNRSRLARNVELQSLAFSVTNKKLVRITLVGYDQEGGAYSPNLIQQSLKLRNG